MIDAVDIHYILSQCIFKVAEELASQTFYPFLVQLYFSELNTYTQEIIDFCCLSIVCCFGYMVIFFYFGTQKKMKFHKKSNINNFTVVKYSIHRPKKHYWTKAGVSFISSLWRSFNNMASPCATCARMNL